MPTTILRFLLTAALPIATMSTSAQPSVSGATCAMPGTTYQYLISGNWDSTSTMQICATGGVVALLNGPCTGNDAPVSSILIIWSAANSSGTLNVNSSSGNTSLAVTTTSPLSAGSIMATSKMQTIVYNAAPTVIYCGADSGGACRPVYIHQWQQSRDNLHWTDILLATAANLTSIPTQHQTIFFRRRTTETVSGTIAYSNSAAVLVGAPPPGTSAASMN